MILLTEAGQVGDSASARDLDRVAAVGRLLGYDVYSIPPDFEECGTAENALWHVPSQSRETPAIWVGFIPSADRYSAVYSAALAKNIRLVNDPTANQIATEFDLAYPLLDDITPASVVLRSPAECSTAGQLLGYPLFLKGAVQSRKQDGWKMCLADDESACASLVQNLMRFKDGTRGRVIARHYVQLRSQQTTGLGVPITREYRCFLFGATILEYGYYWDTPDDFGPLSAEDRHRVEDLARRAAERLPVPYLAVDVGQLDDGGWIVIEVNDGQFSGMSQVSVLSLWNKLRDRVEHGPRASTGLRSVRDELVRGGCPTGHIMCRMSRYSAALLTLLALGALACGAAPAGRSPSPSVPSRLTPNPSSVRNDPGCDFRMAYQGGTVFLNFVTAQTDCGTIQQDVASIGSPFTPALTPVSYIDFPSPTPVCLKSDFRANGVLLAKVLIVLVNHGAADPAATAFCGAWIGSGSS